MTKQELLENAKSLPKQERIDLVMDLWDTIELEADDLPLTDDQKRELDRRIAADDADSRPAEEWTVIRQRLLKGEI